ncbi:hypothetical protein CFAM422_005477 [Trichoderma lentiforme]|uniref:Uncharacterized protein n=1 Tax=Trichoderma lentiforme TaxID=1567552 RepID=A0A9P4XIB5_9HYPO|nr:hypothetical protein CFAM422_005477 [Trichoderma lentiforme]
MASTSTKTVAKTLTEQGVNNNDLLIRSCLRLTASLDVDQASRPDLSRTFEQGGNADKLLPHHVPLDAAISNLLGVSNTFVQAPKPLDNTINLGEAFAEVSRAFARCQASGTRHQPPSASNVSAGRPGDDDRTS